MPFVEVDSLTRVSFGECSSLTLHLKAFATETDATS